MHVDLGESAPYVFLAPISSICLLIWDWALTFDQEVEILWRAKLPIPSKVLFILVRYPALVLHFSSIFFLFLGEESSRKTCNFYNWYRSMLGVFVLTCGDVIVIHRLYGFYERNRYLLWCLSIMLTTTSLGVSIVALLPGGLPDYLRRAKDVFPCGSGPYPRSFSLFWLGQFIFQSIAFCFVAGRYIYAQLQASRSRIRASELYSIFMRDGLWVYLTLSVVNLVGVLYISRPGFTGLTCIFWALTATSVCCTRIMFNLYSSVYDKNEDYSLHITS